MATTTLNLAVFVIGYYITHVGNVLLLFKINKQRSIYGVSVDAQVMLLLATLARIVWIGDTKLLTLTASYVEIALALGLHTALVVQCLRLKDSFQRENPIYLRWFVLTAVSAVLSCIFHPGEKGEYFFTQQMFVSFTMFTEALSLLAQLHYMGKAKALEGLNSKYLVALGVARTSRIYFWYTMSARISTFWYLIAADLIHTVLVAGFGMLYHFVKVESQGADGLLGFQGGRAKARFD